MRGAELLSQSIAMLEGCSFRYPNTDKDIFKDVDLSVDSKSRLVSRREWKENDFS